LNHEENTTMKTSQRILPGAVLMAALLVSSARAGVKNVWIGVNGAT
jgi:hypothetical protein